MQRPQITEEVEKKAIELIMARYKKKIAKKGRGAFASCHEIFGRAQQELHEFEDDVHLKTIDSEKIAELGDVVTACIWGVASILGGECD